MATAYDTMKGQISALQAAIMKELPETRVYSSGAMFEIFKGIGEVRSATQSLFLDFMAASMRYEIRDVAKAQYDIYTASWPFTPYSQALYEARNTQRVNVVLPDYNFRRYLYNFLESTKKAVSNATLVSEYAKFISGLTAIWGAISSGISRIYNGVKMVVKTAVAAVEGAIDTAAFLSKYWMIIGAGIGYLWYTRGKE